MPRRPRVTFRGRVPITAAGVAVGTVSGELLEAIVHLAIGGPTDSAGEPLSAEDVLAQIRAALDREAPDPAGEVARLRRTAAVHNRAAIAQFDY